MKTVLVLTLLAVTIACCYARPAERANEPSWQASHSETAEHSQRPEHPGISDRHIQLQCIAM